MAAKAELGNPLGEADCATTASKTAPHTWLIQIDPGDPFLSHAAWLRQVFEAIFSNEEAVNAIQYFQKALQNTLQCDNHLWELGQRAPAWQALGAHL